MAKVAIVPTVTETTPAGYQAALKKVGFARRLHIDVTDGQFAPNRTLNLAQIYSPEDVALDLHLMVENPVSQLETAISLDPSLVIWHVEAESDHAMIARELRQLGIKAGLAVLPATEIGFVADLLPQIDHLLIFAGRLGFQGGKFDEAVLEKIRQAKKMAPELEIGVDGGVNEDNALKIVAAGATVLNCGSYFQNAAQPKLAFTRLMKLVGAV